MVMFITAVLCIAAFVGAAMMTPDNDDDDDHQGGMMIPVSVPT